MFMNRIAADIHKQCVTKIVEHGLYETDPVSFRRRVEDCFQNCVAQQQIVEKGIQKYFMLKGVNMWQKQKADICDFLLCKTNFKHLLFNYKIYFRQKYQSKKKLKINCR